MQDKQRPGAARGLTIAHLTNLRDDERCTFVHAVALAQRSGSKLLSVHANDDASALARLPRAAELLADWKMLPKGAREGDEQTLGMSHERILDSTCDDPVDTLLRILQERKPDLLIGATAGRVGLARAMMGSVAEALALQAHAPALLLPQDCRPFVSEDDGKVRLSRILVAAGDRQATEQGALHAAWIAELAGAREVDIELLHVEDGGIMPSVSLPQRAGLRFHQRLVSGSIEAALLDRADEWLADLIVMATRGHDSLGDVLLGSHAERVLRRASSPLLSIPLH